MAAATKSSLACVSALLAISSVAAQDPAEGWMAYVGYSHIQYQIRSHESTRIAAPPIPLHSWFIYMIHLV